MSLFSIDISGLWGHVQEIISSMSPLWVWPVAIILAGTLLGWGISLFHAARNEED